MNVQLLSSLVVVVFAVAVIIVRIKASAYPTSAKKILIPPMGMSTGFLMFLFPETHIPWKFAGLAFVCGCALSYPLVATSKMYVEKGKVYLKRSMGFVVILLGLLAVRLALHQLLEQYVSIPETGALFFLLAFGMILPWRIVMYVMYQNLMKKQVTVVQ